MDTSLTTIKNLEIDQFLAQYDGYISALARKSIYKIRNSIVSDSLDMEIDELAQRVRIKLWKALLQQHIVSPKIYIARIIHNETISLLRQQKHKDLLIFNEEGEPHQGRILVVISEGMADPAYEVEQRETSRHYLSRVAQAVASLAPHQRRAMLCSLKDRLDDFASFVIIYGDPTIATNLVNWPNKRDELQRLKASISYARKNVRSLMKM